MQFFCNAYLAIEHGVQVQYAELCAMPRKAMRTKYAWAVLHMAA